MIGAIGFVRLGKDFFANIIARLVASGNLLTAP